MLRMNSMLIVAIPYICVVLTAAYAFSIDYADDFFPGEFDSPSNMYERSARSSSGVEKRDWSSPACRRCMFRRDDWRSCVTCYSRPGAAVPFYGGFTKRSGGPSIQEEKRTAIDYCRCCLASTDNSRCCSRCDMTPYYVSYGKRGYHTSFVPMDYTGAGRCSTCCNPDTFDYYCCAFSCGEKRRK